MSSKVVTKYRPGLERWIKNLKPALCGSRSSSSVFRSFHNCALFIKVKGKTP